MHTHLVLYDFFATFVNWNKWNTTPDSEGVEFFKSWFVSRTNSSQAGHLGGGRHFKKEEGHNQKIL